MAVLLVVTEHSSFLTPAAVRRYESVRTRVERAAARPVSMLHYEEIESLTGADAVVLSGSRAPWAAHDQRALERLGEAVRDYRGPVLGICAGAQLQAMFAGGSVRTIRPRAVAAFRRVDVLDDADLLAGLAPRATFWEHHTDEIVALPDGFRVLASSRECGAEAIADPARRWWGTQFHPEKFSREHPAGERVLRNFFELTGVS